MLHDLIAARVDVWRTEHYACPDYPAVQEILAFQRDSATGAPRYLREPQLRALETYWYLRLVERTANTFELYRRFFPGTRSLMTALGLTSEALRDLVLDAGLDLLFERVRTDADFVQTHGLESVRETLQLDYASYILALAMGAGKTILIGAIIATEFAMSLESPDGPFVENALVFAPGKTIQEALKEIATVAYQQVLPPRLYRPFAASLRLTFTRDGEKNVPVIPGSSFNVVVTNTEKIRIQKRATRARDPRSVLLLEREATEEANARLQAIASLPHLAIFSDEAHHTFGTNMDNSLKRVRQTINYLHANTNLIVVVNTTGTPYIGRQLLKDVVIWYGLSQGIRDGILKDVTNGIITYDFADQDAAVLVREVVLDFWAAYENVALPDGARAKLAIYFPQTADLGELKPVVEAALASVGQQATLVLENTSQSSQADQDAFLRLNHPNSPHRVILLVNKGTEGWNCPSLFACALARRLQNANNFVLQAATRCLREVPGNVTPARIYLSQANHSVLDRQLQETYGESLAGLESTQRERGVALLRLRKLDLPPLRVTQRRRRVVPAPAGSASLTLNRPQEAEITVISRGQHTLGQQATTGSVLQQVGETQVILRRTRGVTEVSLELAGLYRLDLWTVLDELRRVYPDGEVPGTHLGALTAQLERVSGGFEVIEEEVEVALALVKPSGFTLTMEPDGTQAYTTQITYFKDREHLLLKLGDVPSAAGFGFHYAPYNFDSRPEQSYYEQALRALNLTPDTVQDVYFTGGLTSPDKTDFFVEYQRLDGSWHTYTPDFVVRFKDGRCLIVEIKSERERDHPLDGEHGRKAEAARRWEHLGGPDLDRIQYQMIFTSTDQVEHADLQTLRSLLQEVPHARN